MATILPTKMTLGGVTFEILSFMEEDEDPIKGSVMIERGEKLKANLSQEYGKFICQHRAEIPVELHEVMFVFPSWWAPRRGSDVAYLTWLNDRWVLIWIWLIDSFGSARCRFVRREDSSS